MNIYVIRGHGAFLQRPFRLKEGQYLLFTTSCGLPGAKATLVNNRVYQLLKSPATFTKFIKGELKNANLPVLFKNPILMQPGDLVSDHIIEMKNASDPRFMETAGLWKIEPGKNLYTYLGYRGRTRTISSLIGTKKGIFVYDACRVSIGTTQQEANNMLKKMLNGASVAIESQYAKNVARYENYVRKQRLKKRKRAGELREEAHGRITKKMRTNNVTMNEA